MIESKLDSNAIETALHLIVDAIYDGIVYCGNRPSISKVPSAKSFVVVKTNLGQEHIFANKRVISSKNVCTIQIWTRSLSGGKKNMTEETRIRNLILDQLPKATNDYEFSYKNEVGDRDLRGFHGKYINLNCQIL